MNNNLSGKWSENHPKDLRTSPKRRAPRMNCRVPVSIEWNGTATGRCVETGFTRVVNAYGCLLVSPKEMELQQVLRVTNLITCQRSDAAVVWKGARRPDGWDVGVELSECQMDFWGVEF